MKPSVAIGIVGAILFSTSPTSGQELTKVRVAWCNKTINSAVAPFAVATKMGWFKEGGIEVELVPFGGSSECIQNLASGQVLFSDSTAEPLAAVHARGVKAKVFYTVLQRNIFGFAVPQDSPIKTIADLKGKTIGETSMASAGVLVARSIAATNGLDPEKDMSLVVVGEAGQTAALVRSKQVDALSQFATQYALVEMAGIKLRMLDNSAIARFPSNGLVALDQTLKSQRSKAVALARGFAMGTQFTIDNPQAAVRIVYDVYPQSRPTGKDEATAVATESAVMRSVDFSQDVRPLGIKRWGESSFTDYADYLNFKLKWNIIKEGISSEDFVTNDLIDDINMFDADKVKKAVAEYK